MRGSLEPSPRPAGHHLSYLTYRSLGAGLQIVPPSAVRAIAAISGVSMALVSPARRAVVRSNLRRVLGPTVTEEELEAAVTDAFHSYARYWIDGARLSTITPEEVLRRIVADGLEHLQAALEAGTGAIMVLPHLGTWEWGGYFLTLMGTPMTTVAEPAEPPELFSWFCSQRERFGLRVLPLSGETTTQLIAALRASKLVGLIADRDVTGNGIEVEFFGERAFLPAGPAVLSLRTGAPLLPTGVFQEPGGMQRGLIRRPVPFERTGRFRDDVVALTQLVAHELEELIKRAPTQWHMFQEIWRADRARTGRCREVPEPGAGDEPGAAEPGSGDLEHRGEGGSSTTR